MDIERVNREVIQGKLLAALDDEGKVAVICNERELWTIINSLAETAEDYDEKQLRDDLMRLHNEAFGG